MAELLSPYQTARLFNPDELQFKQTVVPGAALAAAAEDKNQTPGITPEQKKEMAKTAAAGMSAGGSIGQVLTGAGVGAIAGGAPIMGAAGGIGAAGLALSLYEQKRQADAAEEQAKIAEAENRKAATQNAINGMINVTRGLGV